MTGVLLKRKYKLRDFRCFVARDATGVAAVRAPDAVTVALWSLALCRALAA